MPSFALGARSANRHGARVVACLAEVERRGGRDHPQLDAWFAEGGGLFVPFSYAGLPNKWGSWGALEYQDQPVEQAPKYRALVDRARGSARP